MGARTRVLLVVASLPLSCCCVLVVGEEVRRRRCPLCKVGDGQADLELSRDVFFFSFERHNGIWQPPKLVPDTWHKVRGSSPPKRHSGSIQYDRSR